MQAFYPKIFYGICAICLVTLFVIFVHLKPRYGDTKMFDKRKDVDNNAARNWRLRTHQRHQSYPFLQLVKNSNVEFTPTQLWSIYKPEFACPFNLTRVGRTGDGGKWVCGVEEMRKKSGANASTALVLYSFGIKNDSSFEFEMLQKVNCFVYAYDPTVSSLGTQLHQNDSRIKFFQIGLAGIDSTKYKTLKTLMTQNRHERINLLKMDIEGYEYQSLFKIMEDFPDVLPFDQILVEVHVVRPFNAMWSAYLLEQLENRGLRMVHQEVNEKCSWCCEYTFININS